MRLYEFSFLFFFLFFFVSKYYTYPDKILSAERERERERERENRKFHCCLYANNFSSKLTRRWETITALGGLTRHVGGRFTNTGKSYLIDICTHDRGIWKRSGEKEGRGRGKAESARPVISNTFWISSVMRGKKNFKS